MEIKSFITRINNWPDAIIFFNTLKQILQSVFDYLSIFRICHGINFDINRQRQHFFGFSERTG